MTADPVTPADLARDLAADLALLAECAPGPWHVGVDATGHPAVRWPHGVRSTVAKVYCDFDAAMIAAARDGWPAAIRRALAAEAEADRLRALLGGGAEQVHRMGRELAALRRQLADAHAALREYREDEG
jgi:hypothetical protein